MGIRKEAAGGADTTGLVRDQRHGVVGVNMAKWHSRICIAVERMLRKSKFPTHPSLLLLPVHLPT